MLVYYFFYQEFREYENFFFFPDDPEWKFLNSQILDL